MRKIFSLLAAVLFAGSMMAETYTKTDFANLNNGATVIITMQKGTDVFAASNDKGTGAAPKAVAVSVANDAITTDSTNILWTVVKNGDNITFAVTDTTALYCTNTNNGVRVGKSTNNVFSIDATSGYLFNNATSRYVGVYNSQDFRCYTSVNSNISGQTLAFYAKGGEAPAVATPVISGEAEFTESTQVSISCETEGAAIYYTVDGADPTSNSLPYGDPFTLTESATVKAVAYDSENNQYSAVASKTFTKIPSFDSFEALVAAKLADKTLVSVNFADVLIDSIYTSSRGVRQGIYINVMDSTGKKPVEIYYNKDSVPAEWAAGDTLSGSILGNWTYYANGKQWEIVPSTEGWKWENLTRKAASEVQEVQSWKVNAETDTTAGVKYIDNEYLEVKTIYQTAVVAQNAKILYSEFTHAIQVRAAQYPSDTDPIGAKDASKVATPLVLTAKDDAMIGIFYQRQAVNKLCEDNDNKDLKLFDQAAPTTAITAEFLEKAVATTDSSYYNVLKIVTLKKDHVYTLTAKGTTIKLFGINYPGEDPEPVFPDTLSCAQAAEAALNGMTDSVKVRGYVTEIAYAWKDGSMSFWMADTLNGGKVFEAYKCAIEKQEDAVSVGDLVVATGKLTKYNTTPELAAGCTVEIIEKTQILPKNLGEKTIAEFLNLKNTLDTCILTGVVDSIVNTQYGNLYLSDTTAQLYIYGVLTPAGEARKFAELGVAAGDTLTVLAIYTEYQGAPQAKNAIFVEVKKAPVADTVEVSLSEGLRYYDYVASEGWWQIYGGDDKFVVSVSNISTTQAEGTYTVEDLDPKYTYLGVIEGKDTTFVAFVSGSVTLSTNAEAGSVTVEGTLIGNDNKAYHLNLVFVAPKPTNTVTLNIPEAALIDYYAAYGLYGVYGTNVEKDHQVYIALWAKEGFQGDFTEADIDMEYIGTGVIDIEGVHEVYTASITVTPGNGGDYNITADMLCYNNTLYKVTMYVPAAQAIDEVDAAQKAVKMIKGGQLIIEKAGKSYNVLGTRL